MSSQFLKSFSVRSIRRSDFKYTFSRSSGPGGQNVNKVNSKVSVKCAKPQWESASWLPAEVRCRLTKANFPYLTKGGDVLVSSQLSRSQQQNLDDCFGKLAGAIKKAAFVPEGPSEEAAKRWAGIKRAQNLKRLDSKKQHTAKKQFRKERLD